MKHTKRIETPETIAESANGTGPYIEVKTRIKGKYSNALVDFSMALMKVSRLDDKALIEANQTEGDDNPAEMAAYKVVMDLDEKREALYTVYAELVTDWNWLDPDTEEPLPKPYQNPDVFKNELDQSQMAFVNEAINKLMKYKGNGGKRDEALRLELWAKGEGKSPPPWVKYLGLSDKWSIPPWELERLDLEDETASLWIERHLFVTSLMTPKLPRKKHGK